MPDSKSEEDAYLKAIVRKREQEGFPRNTTARNLLRAAIQTHVTSAKLYEMARGLSRTAYLDRVNKGKL